MSRCTHHGARRAVLLLAAVFVVLVYLPSVSWADQSMSIITAKLLVFQEYKVPLSGLQSTFEYVIEPVDEDAPMPIDADGEPFDSFKLTRDEDMWLEFPVKVELDPSATPFVYHYIIRPAQKELTEGLYYVDVLSTSLSAGINEYALELHVLPSSVDAAHSVVVPTVHVREFDGPKVADPGWRVSYAEPEKEPEEQPGDGQNKDEGSQSNGSAIGSSKQPSQINPASTGVATSVPSRVSLATTGDALGPQFVLALIACVGISSLAIAAFLRRRAGDGDA